MIYSLVFLESAKKEWDDLASPIQKQLKTKLFKIIEHPHIPKNKLTGLKDYYKIKLRSSGYRLVYHAYDDRVVVQVVAIGKRDKSAIYRTAHQRI